MQQRNIACGGRPIRDTCWTFVSNGTWITSHHLIYERVRSSSWATDSGILLVGDGGTMGQLITELVTYQGTTEESFTLKYGILYKYFNSQR